MDNKLTITERDENSKNAINEDNDKIVAPTELQFGAIIKGSICIEEIMFNTKKHKLEVVKEHEQSLDRQDKIGYCFNMIRSFLLLIVSLLFIFGGSCLTYNIMIGKLSFTKIVDITDVRNNKIIQAEVLDGVAMALSIIMIILGLTFFLVVIFTHQIQPFANKEKYEQHLLNKYFENILDNNEWQRQIYAKFDKQQKENQQMLLQQAQQKVFEQITQKLSPEERVLLQQYMSQKGVTEEQFKIAVSQKLRELEAQCNDVSTGTTMLSFALLLGLCL